MSPKKSGGLSPFGAVAWVSFAAFLSVPFCILLSIFLEHLEGGSIALSIGIVSCLCIGLMTYFYLPESSRRNPLFYMFTVFCFTCILDLLLSLHIDGVIHMGYLEHYLRKAEPYLFTAHSCVIMYWDGIVQFLLYLHFIYMIVDEKKYTSMALWWLGSIINSVMVFLPAGVVGQHGPSMTPAYLLNVPYFFLPMILLRSFFNESVKVADFERKKSVFIRLVDFVLMILVVLWMAAAVLRVVVALGSEKLLFVEYLSHIEPALGDPNKYPVMQAIVYAFVGIPFFVLVVQDLLRSRELSQWMRSSLLVAAGVVAQGQFSYVASAFHWLTPDKYRMSNIGVGVQYFIFLIPHILVLRCAFGRIKSKEE